jgi:VanZ family protein
MMKKWAVLLAGLIMLVIVLADTQRLGFLGAIYDFPYGDKVGHFLLFGTLGLLANLAAFEVWPKRARPGLVLRVSLGLAVLIGIEELSQRFFPSRQSSIWDWLTSCAGVASFAVLALWLSAWRAKADTARQGTGKPRG